MSLWVLRGLRGGVVTTRWPKRPDGYADGWRGPATVHDPYPAGTAGLGELCPTGAISITGQPGAVRLDQGRCILCGRCVDSRPDVFAWSAGTTGPGAAALTRGGLVVPEVTETDAAVEAVRARLFARTVALRRSVHVRHVDAGSDGSEEWEVLALLGPVYDVHRLGVFFTASPRHADILLVRGPARPEWPGRCEPRMRRCPIPGSSSPPEPTRSAAGCCARATSPRAGFPPAFRWTCGCQGLRRLRSASSMPC